MRITTSLLLFTSAIFAISSYAMPTQSEKNIWITGKIKTETIFGHPAIGNYQSGASITYDGQSLLTIEFGRQHNIDHTTSPFIASIPEEGKTSFFLSSLTQNFGNPIEGNNFPLCQFDITAKGQKDVIIQAKNLVPELIQCTTTGSPMKKDFTIQIRDTWKGMQTSPPGKQAFKKIYVTLISDYNSPTREGLTLTTPTGSGGLFSHDFYQEVLSYEQNQKMCTYGGKITCGVSRILINRSSDSDAPNTPVCEYRYDYQKRTGSLVNLHPFTPNQSNKLVSCYQVTLGNNAFIFVTDHKKES